MATDAGTRCPACGEERLIEHDSVLRHWHSALWACREVGRSNPFLPIRREGAEAHRPAHPFPRPRMARPPETVTLIVRRGALRRFDRLVRDTRDLPATVIWDRRQGERRAASHTVAEERRTAERRRPVPFTWEVADFVVVTNGLAADVGAENDSR